MKIPVFLSENFQFLEVKFSIYLNRRCFVMASKTERQNERTELQVRMERSTLKPLRVIANCHN